MLLAIISFLMMAFSCARQPTLPPLPIQGAPGESLFRQAEMKFQSQHYSDAIQLYQDYTNLYPDSPLVPSAIMKIGAIHLVQNRYPEARHAYMTLIRTAPESQFIPDAELGILMTYYHEGQYEELLLLAGKLDDRTISREIYQRKYALLGDACQATSKYFQAVDSYLKVYLATGNAEKKKELLLKMETAASNLTAEEIRHFFPLAEENQGLKGSFEYMLALAYVRAEQYEDAFNLLTHYTAAYPEHDHIEDANQLLSSLISMSDYDRTLVGCLLPLSGRYKTFGERALKGIELAFMQYSEDSPGTDIRLVIRDTMGNPEMTEALVNELAEQKVAALIGPIVTANEAARQAQSHRIPIITMTQKEGITDIGDFVFRNFITPEAQTKTMASFAIEHLGLHKFAILYPNEKYGTTFMNLFWDHVMELGGEIRGVESYEPDQADFSPSIKKLVGLYYDIPEELKQATPPDTAPDGQEAEDRPEEEDGPKAIVDFDAIFIPDGPEKAGLILPQLTYYDVTDVYLMGTNLWHSDKLIQMAEQFAQSAIMPELFFAESANETVNRFVHNYTETYGETPGLLEAIAYDTGRIILQTISGPDLRFRDSIRNRLVNLENFQGVTGKTTFNENGEANKELFILQINGLTFSELAYQ